MNIIEAVQKAENGVLITNNFLKSRNIFLQYVKTEYLQNMKLLMINQFINMR